MLFDKILVATYNKGKVREIIPFLEDHVKNVICLDDIADPIEVEETGTTFFENAVLKAEGFFKYTGIPTLADDSGLEVDALDGEPGVYSARYGGEDASDIDNNSKLLGLIKKIPADRRQGRFRCVMAFAVPEGTHTFEGAVEGVIQDHLTGEYGFGYDPLFTPNGYDKTFGVLGKEVKFKISHRTRAIQKFIKFLRNSAK